MILVCWERAETGKRETRRKMEIIKSIAFDRGISKEEKLNILRKFRKNYDKSRENDDFYGILIRVLTNDLENRIRIKSSGGVEFPEKLDQIEIRNGKEKWEINFWATTTLVSFSDGEGGGKVARYDILGEKVAECSLKNGRPFEGTFWDLVLGLQWVKWSDIIIASRSCRIDGSVGNFSTNFSTSLSLISLALASA